MVESEDLASSPAVPLVRLILILPFVEALDERGTDADAVLMRNGLVRETVLDADIFVPGIVIHRFLEDAAMAAGDPHLGLHVGAGLALNSWPPFVDAASRARTLGEFLIRFIRSARDEASSAYHCLEVKATYAFFKETRTTQPEIVPAQNDAFMAAFTLDLLNRGAGERWDPTRVRLTVSDTRALPEGYRGVSILGGDRMGISVRFPTEWLSCPIDGVTMAGKDPVNQHRLRVPVDLREALRQTLGIRLHESGQGLDEVARLAGMSRQSLQRRLKASGTSLSRELAALRQQRASELLTRNTHSIADIAAAVGFGNPTSFTRAFKAWTGHSPRAYRKAHGRGCHPAPR